MMSKLAQVGGFCPSPDCPDHSKLQSEDQTNIIKFGKTKSGRQRFQCKTCGDTFVETKGTIFYRRRTPDDEIIETLAFIAEGSRISSAARVKGHKKDTIIDWIQDAGDHAEAIEEVLLADYQIERGQLDALWAYVRNKGEKRTTPKPTKPASSGALP
jgi:transposase-like protein